jgi:Questin oxidase-like
VISSPLPDPLLELLRAHAATHAPYYSVGNLSDHGPMACLALHGLGASLPEIERYAARYQQRLSPLPVPSVRLGPDDWHRHVGLRDSYPSLLAFFGEQLSMLGQTQTLASYLPPLISGWVLDLFHPLIRLGYGIEFGVPSEIAAGLAYLACCGDAPALAEAARLPASASGGSAFLKELRAQRVDPGGGGPGAFNRRFRAVVGSAAPLPAGGATARIYTEMSRACLEVFDSTHDFFALHLVTGCHAFRTCSPWLDSEAVGLFSVGIAAAYLAAGAPDFTELGRIEGSPSLEEVAATTDEHDIKLAYTCAAMTRGDADAAYSWVAHRYLTRRLP